MFCVFVDKRRKQPQKPIKKSPAKSVKLKKADVVIAKKQSPKNDETKRILKRPTSPIFSDDDEAKFNPVGSRISSRSAITKQLKKKNIKRPEISLSDYDAPSSYNTDPMELLSAESPKSELPPARKVRHNRKGWLTLFQKLFSHPR